MVIYEWNYIGDNMKLVEEYLGHCRISYTVDKNGIRFISDICYETFLEGVAELAMPNMHNEKLLQSLQEPDFVQYYFIPTVQSRSEVDDVYDVIRQSLYNKLMDDIHKDLYIYEVDEYKQRKYFKE